MNMEKYGESEYVTVDLLSKLQSKMGVILDAGLEEMGKFGVQVKFRVEFVGGKIKLWRPNRQCVNVLCQAWGAESSGWVGKQLSFVVDKDKITVQPVIERSA